MKPLDATSARQLITTLVERKQLLLAAKTSANALAAALAEEAFESAAEIAEWLVEQDSVVDLLASDDDIAAALSPAPVVPPPKKLEARHWRWDAHGTTLTVLANDLDGVIDATREWWRRVLEFAGASDPEVDAILCYLEEEGLSAYGVIDPEAELEGAAANASTTLPDAVSESDWCVSCRISPTALGDDDSDVLEEEPTVAMLVQAVGRSKVPLYFWDAEYDGAVRRVDRA